MKIKDALNQSGSTYDWKTDKEKSRKSMTAGRARMILAAAQEKMLPDKPAKINPVMTEQQALDILSNGIPAGADDDFVLHPLLARNIAREFARFA